MPDKPLEGEVVKNPVGKPLRYKTVKELELAVEDYFNYCDNRTRSVYIEKLGDNIEVSAPAPYTMSGLARALDLSRQALSEYNARDKYGDAIKAARARVEEYNENQLHEGRNAAGVIFNLKNNFGWKDKTEQDLNVKMPKPILGSASVQEDEDDSL